MEPLAVPSKKANQNLIYNLKIITFLISLKMVIGNFDKNGLV